MGHYLTFTFLAYIDPVLNIDGKKFRPVSNTENGTVDASVRFEYHQNHEFFWGYYKGGSIIIGTMVGHITHDDFLNFGYCHLDDRGILRRGRCISRPERVKDGRLRFYEKWEWTDGDRSKGNSIVEEIPV